MNIIQLIQDQFRPVLSDRTILKYNKNGWLFEKPLRPEQIQPNSVDLTLADTWSIPNTNSFDDNFGEYINPSRRIYNDTGKFRENFNDKRAYLLYTGEFVCMATKEKLKIPSGIVAFVQGRSSIARLGIQTEQAGLVDSGFYGTITLEVENQSKHPILLIEGMRIAQVWFIKSQHADLLYSKEHMSKYNNQVEATGSRIHLDKEWSD